MSGSNIVWKNIKKYAFLMQYIFFSSDILYIKKQKLNHSLHFDFYFDCNHVSYPTDECKRNRHRSIYPFLSSQMSGARTIKHIKLLCLPSTTTHLSKKKYSSATGDLQGKVATTRRSGIDFFW